MPLQDPGKFMARAVLAGRLWAVQVSAISARVSGHRFHRRRLPLAVELLIFSAVPRQGLMLPQPAAAPQQVRQGQHKVRQVRRGQSRRQEHRLPHQAALFTAQHPRMTSCGTLTFFLHGQAATRKAQCHQVGAMSPPRYSARELLEVLAKQLSKNVLFYIIYLVKHIV